MEKYKKELLLNKLIDKYENSQLSKLGSKRNLSIKLKMSTYDKRYFDSKYYSYYQAYEETFTQLLDNDFILLKREGNYVLEVILNLNQLESIYTYLGRESIQAIRLETLNILSKYDFESAFYLIKREKQFISNRQYFKDNIELEKIMLAIKFLKQERDRELTIRVFSQNVFYDSKVFEQIMSKVLRLLKDSTTKYADYSDEELLDHFGIVRNPTYIMVKGNLKLSMNNQNLDLSKIDGSIGISSDTLQNVEVIKDDLKYVLCVENLDSFHQLKPTKGVVVYLAGFHSRVKNRFLTDLSTIYPHIDFYHFGDIDVGGFRIFKNLCEQTNIKFKPFLMDLETLEKYKKYGKKLSTEEITLLNQQDLYFKDLSVYMIMHKVKLEQEIIDAAGKLLELENGDLNK